jgi:hypothetical protein
MMPGFEDFHCTSISGRDGIDVGSVIYPRMSSGWGIEILSRAFAAKSNPEAIVINPMYNITGHALFVTMMQAAGSGILLGI